MDSLTDRAAYFEEIGHPNAGDIQARRESLVSRFEALKEPLATRKKKLIDFLHLLQLFRDTEDEEAWIEETEPSVASTYLGESLTMSGQSHWGGPGCADRLRELGHNGWGAFRVYSQLSPRTLGKIFSSLP